jgi:cytochrome P450
VREVFRWGSVGPLGLPHMLREDDVHNGYMIPKGAILMPNVW